MSLHPYKDEAGSRVFLLKVLVSDHCLSLLEIKYTTLRPWECLVDLVVSDVRRKVIKNDYMESSLFSVAIRSNDPIVTKIVARQRTNSLPLLTLTAE